jgi:hypothetical protein
MNNEQERDTHFLGFAKLLWDELKPDLQLDYLAGSLQDSWALVNEFEPLDLPALEARAKLIIAQRAYDLTVHTFEALSPFIYVPKPNATEFDLIAQVPDLTAWPTPKEPS